jgi:hypothetical protein
MAEIVTGLIAAVFDGAKEILAIVSNLAFFYSAFQAIISLANIIANQGLINGVISWLIISIVTTTVTGLIAETLSSAIPSPFRWMTQVIELLIEIA